VNVTLACPVCEQPAATSVDHDSDWQCPACDHALHLHAAEPALPACVVCGNTELYKKKDFPHWLGMTILVSACVLSTLTYYWYAKWWTWSFLIGSALIDGLMYLWVGDVIVCYRCQAHYRGFPAAGDHPPFELSIGERYRQEQIRHARLKGHKSES
jgi:hypothetical protein